MLRGAMMQAVKWFRGERSVIEETPQASVLELEAERKFREEKQRLQTALNEREELRGKVDSIGDQLREALGADDDQGKQAEQQKQ
jgi:hypothetical protein